MSITPEALGRLFDIGTCWAPLDLDTADGATGKRIAMTPGRGITVVAFVGVAASGTDNLTFDVQQHTAYTGGTSNDMDSTNSAIGIDHYWIKSETALDNDEAWVQVTQTAASEVVVTGTTYAALQKLVVFEIHDAMLAEGYTHVSIACTAGNVAQLSSCIYLVHELRYQRRPDRLLNLLNPGAANA